MRDLTVIVSLTFARHVGILSVQGSQFQISTYPLKTVRPFELDEVVLAEEAAKPDSKINLDEKDTISAFLRGRVSVQEVNVGG